MPAYVIVDKVGPEHARTFEVEVRLNGDSLGRGSGPSKSVAEQEAAADRLRHLQHGVAARADAGGLYEITLNPLERLMAIAGGLLLIIPGWLTDSIGLVLIAAVVVWQKLRVKKQGGQKISAV